MSDPAWLKPEQWFPVDAPLRNAAGARSKQAYLEVVQQFHVATAVRYQRNAAGFTQCNIFVWDVSRAMGCEIPHWVDAPTKSKPASPGHGNAELDANGVGAWLQVHGRDYAWREVAADETLFRAENGFPSSFAWINPKGIGHVGMVVPGLEGNGLHVAQAGSHNFVNVPIGAVFTAEQLKATKFYSHD